MARRVVVTGMGVVSPLGDSPAAVQAALLEGRGRPAEVEPALTPGGAGGRAFRLRSFAPETYLGNRNLRPLDRVGRLVASAASLALADSGWTADRRRDEEVGLVVGTMFSVMATTAAFDRNARKLGPSYASPMDFANTVSNAPAGQAAIWHNLRGVNSTLAAGTASGAQALAYATDLIRLGRATAVLAGGADEVSMESFHGFARAGLLSGPQADPSRPPLPFDARRDGFVLGEGAALLMLESADAAAARGARVLAEVKGHGSRFDPSRGADGDRVVATVAGAINSALGDAGLGSADVDCVSASANGSVDGDRHEAAALAAVFRHHRPGLAVTAAKAQLGEALGAGGALQAVALVEAMRTGRLPGVPGLGQVEEPFLRGKADARARDVALRNGVVNSAGLDGPCCALVLAAWEQG
jgi:3-oxoacyl-[acyl-carrier-protein] synthase II